MDPTGLRLDPGCGWGKSCTKKPASPPPPSYWISVPVQELSNGTTINQLRRNPDYKPRPVTSSIWGPTTLELNRTSLIDRAIAGTLPKSTASNKKPLQPGWGPLVGTVPNYQWPQPEFGVGGQLCFVLCGGIEWAPSSGFSGSVMLGPRGEVSFNTGVSMQEPAPFHVIGECSATAVVGAAAQVGLGVAEKQDSPGGIRLATTSSGGIRYGGGGDVRSVSSGASRLEVAMSAQAVVGVIVVCVGVLVIILNRQIPRLIHFVLRLFYGEPMADDAVRPNSTWKHIIIVGCAFIAFGVFMILAPANPR